MHRLRRHVPHQARQAEHRGRPGKGYMLEARQTRRVPPTQLPLRPHQESRPAGQQRRWGTRRQPGGGQARRAVAVEATAAAAAVVGPPAVRRSPRKTGSACFVRGQPQPAGRKHILWGTPRREDRGRRSDRRQEQHLGQEALDIAFAVVDSSSSDDQLRRRLNAVTRTGFRSWCSFRRLMGQEMFMSADAFNR